MGYSRQVEVWILVCCKRKSDCFRRRSPKNIFTFTLAFLYSVIIAPSVQMRCGVVCNLRLGWRTRFALWNIFFFDKKSPQISLIFTELNIASRKPLLTSFILRGPTRDIFCNLWHFFLIRCTTNFHDSLRTVFFLRKKRRAKRKTIRPKLFLNIKIFNFYLQKQLRS